ncbi:SulP family inorganic anion transporter [Thalassospira marina]|uniref:Sodium-independent anion transporter n=1 Tax=Thalassospira marina TaxID=2048283 RepID=A0A2N3KY85_9PROT|nr:SulP family inorganic anion transporter [Thalassospira marina]PKR55535.1 sodium-independent anion transporter [Thalassospira marina]
MNDISARKSSGWTLFLPKLVTVFREGYSLANLRQDAISGMTVAVVALPLSMALAIASGATPDKGLITAIIAGFFISALGGSRFQIGGPTGAFVVVVFNVIAQYGYDGLIIATLMAGIMLIIAGLARFGTWIKYIPEPVVTGFTSGIAVIIFTSQIKDLFGLKMAEMPAEFIAKIEALWQARATLDPVNLAIALGALAIIIIARRTAPKLPSFLIAVALASLVVAIGNLPIDTIGSRFGGISAEIGLPTLPVITTARIMELMPSAFTIAFLAGIESLLSAMVADGMTGRRHRSNCELVAQGVANLASGLFGGLPATGAIARTATNIRSGAKSPVSGMLHAVFLLVFMLLLAPLANYIPLAALAAVLMVVAWNMSEIDRFARLLRGPLGDRLVLVLTFGLTVMVDLTVAIQAGVVLAAILFMHRMSESVIIAQTPANGANTALPNRGTANGTLIRQDQPDALSDNPIARDGIPDNLEIYRLSGPLFFGVANRLTDVIDSVAGYPRDFILCMDDVPMIDASGASRIEHFISTCNRHGTRLFLVGLRPQPQKVLAGMCILDQSALQVETDIASALHKIRPAA